jgi:hypothetical protein
MTASWFQTRLIGAGEWAIDDCGSSLMYLVAGCEKALLHGIEDILAGTVTGKPERTFAGDGLSCDFGTCGLIYRPHPLAGAVGRGMIWLYAHPNCRRALGALRGRLGLRLRRLERSSQSWCFWGFERNGRIRRREQPGRHGWRRTFLLASVQRSESLEYAHCGDGCGRL